MNDVILNFIEFMQSHGIEPSEPGRIEPTSQVKRFHIRGDKPNSENGWFILHADDHPNGVFGTWKNPGERINWKPAIKQTRQFTEQEKKDFAEKRLKREAEAQAAIERVHIECAEKSQEIWSNAQAPDPSHPYLIKKNIKPILARQVDDRLVIPVTKNKKIVGLQYIFPDGEKRFKTGTDIKGAYATIGKPDSAVVITEGFATAASIYEATQIPVVIAFNAGNLFPVASTIRQRLPEAKIIIAADNDQWTKGNPGVQAAQKAAEAIKGEIRIAHFMPGAEGKPTDFNDVAALYGLDEVKSQIEKNESNVIPKDESDFPFTFLGYREGIHFVLQHKTQDIRAVSSSHLTETGLLQLAPLDVWALMFAGKTASGINKPKAINWFIRQSESEGRFMPDKVRGRGAWSDRGSAVYHLGEKLWVNGETIGLYDLASYYVYPVGDPMPIPATEALTNTDGARILTLAQGFQWIRPASGKILAGWLALAPICGALRWRPHLWVTGGPGSGKTTIQNDFVGVLLKGFAVNAQGNSTEAGIRQRLKLDALPVLFDEAESNNEREASRVQNILSLIRQSSSESASEILKGTPGGDAQRFMIRSMFYLSSIQVGMRQQADLERITVLDLRPKTEHVNAAEQWSALSSELSWVLSDESLSSKLLRRALNLLPTTLENIKTFSKVAAIKFGNQREGDQFGALMAGAWSLVSEELATEHDAAIWIDAEDWAEYRERSDGDEAEKVLYALLNSQVIVEHGQRRTIAELCLESENPANLNSVGTLGRHGIKYESGRIFIHNGSQHISALLRDTQYAVAWRDQLLRVKGARKETRTIRIAGVSQRCISVPVDIKQD